MLIYSTNNFFSGYFDNPSSSQYLKKQGIICDELEVGCHRKEVINDVVNSMNEKLGSRKIAVPMKLDEIEAMEEVIKTLN